MSEWSEFQYSSAFFQVLPFGVNSLSFTYSIVFSSGAIIPPLAPISMLKLQTVILPSMDMSSKTFPAYSTKKPVAPDAERLEIINRATSFGVTPFCNLPLIEILILLGFCCIIH